MTYEKSVRGVVTDTTERVVDHLEAQRGDVVRLCTKLVRVPSLSGEESAVARLIEEEMKKRGFDEVFVDNIGNVIGVVRGARRRPVLVYNGHMDHVDPGDLSMWKADPYSAELMDGRVFGVDGQVICGRAASDMKGAIAAMIEAGGAIKASGVPLAGDLVLTMVVLEEQAECRGTVFTVERNGIKPDLAVSGEATDLNVYLGHRGRVELRVTTLGRVAHASNPARGINAIAKMAKLLGAVERVPGSPGHPLLGESTWAFTQIDCRPGRLSVIPDRCGVTLDIRYLLDESPETWTKWINDIVGRLEAEDPEFKAEVEQRKNMPPFLTSADLPFVKMAVRVAERVTGRRPSLGAWKFGTDVTYLSNRLGIPVIGFGPGNERYSHTPEDHVRTDDLVAATKFYAALAVEALGEK